MTCTYCGSNGHKLQDCPWDKKFTINLDSVISSFWAGLQIIVGLLVLLSLYSFVGNVEANDGEYVKNLESVVAKCTDRGLHEIWIGNEQYLCGAYPTGEKR